MGPRRLQSRSEGEKVVIIPNLCFPISHETTSGRFSEGSMDRRWSPMQPYAYSQPTFSPAETTTATSTHSYFAFYVWYDSFFLSLAVHPSRHRRHCVTEPINRSSTDKNGDYSKSGKIMLPILIIVSGRHRQLLPRLLQRN